VLVWALGSAVKLSVAVIERRGHATWRAREAAESGADVVLTLGGDGTAALRRLTIAGSTRTVTQLAWQAGDPRGKQVLRLHDITEFTVVASRPQAFQLDGDHPGERQKVHFVSVASALRVIC
jgi:diacylglycerol kinase family enzyme